MQQKYTEKFTPIQTTQLKTALLECIMRCSQESTQLRRNHFMHQRQKLLLSPIFDSKMDEDPLNTDETTIDDYLKKIYTLYTNHPDEYELTALNSINFSVCPKCSDPALHIGTIVTCVNSCFKFKIDPSMFTEAYTLDNLMDEYMDILRSHPNCGGAVNILIFQDKICPYCVKCFNLLTI